MVLERLDVLSGDLLTCVESDGRHCLRYLQTCDGDDCLTDSSPHPVVPSTEKKKKKRKRPAKKKQETTRETRKRVMVQMKKPPGAKRKKTTEAEKKQILELIKEKPRTMEEIGDAMDMEAYLVSSAVVMLDIQGKAGLRSGGKGKPVVVFAREEAKKPEAARKIQKAVKDVSIEELDEMKKMRIIPDYPAISDVYFDLEKKRPKVSLAGIGLALGGDLLTCSQWQIMGPPGGEYIRCQEYKLTCKPGEANCIPKGGNVTVKRMTAAEKGKPEAPKIAEPRKQDMESILFLLQEDPLTVEQIGKRLFLAPEYVTGVVARLDIAGKVAIEDTAKGVPPRIFLFENLAPKATQAFGEFWFFIPKRARTPQRIPEDVKGADFEKFLSAEQRGTGKTYRVFSEGWDNAERKLKATLKKASVLRKEIGGGFNKYQPSYHRMDRNLGYRAPSLDKAEFDKMMDLLPKGHSDLTVQQRLERLPDPKRRTPPPVPKSDFSGGDAMNVKIPADATPSEAISEVMKMQFPFTMYVWQVSGAWVANTRHPGFHNYYQISPGVFDTATHWIPHHLADEWETKTVKIRRARGKGPPNLGMNWLSAAGMIYNGAKALSAM